MSTLAPLPPPSPPPPPPPPPPPALEDEDTLKSESVVVSKHMLTLVSYGDLVPFEECVCKSPYDVMSWFSYLEEVDSILESLYDEIKQRKVRKKNKSGDFEVGGKILKFDELKTCFKNLELGRSLIGERALSLLPGSYKLWRMHLTFRSTPPFLPSNYSLISSNSRSRYKATLSAFERSLVRMNKMPRIWLQYLAFLVQHSAHSFTFIRRTFDRALLALPATQHDTIWTQYICYLTMQLPPKHIQNNQKLRDGPIANLIKAGTLSSLIPVPTETKLRVLRRHARCFDTSARETLANICLQHQRFGEAAALFLEILNDEHFISPNGTNRHDLWITLADIATHHPTDVKKAGVDFHAIVRAALNPQDMQTNKDQNHAKGPAFKWAVFNHLRHEEEQQQQQPTSSNNTTNQDKYKDANDSSKLDKSEERRRQLRIQLGEMEGTLWTKLADYHIRSGEFEIARSIYEEALDSVSRVRDFSFIFDAYVKFEEGVIEALMELMQDDEENDEEDDDNDNADDHNNHNEQNINTEQQNDDDNDMDILLGDAATRGTTPTQDGQQNASADVELALARAEYLMARRPLLLNRVLLRQNPHNVGEWLKRAELYVKQNKTDMAVRALEEAVKAVDARKSVNGAPCTLYIQLANIHENKLNDIQKTRQVYNRVCTDLEYDFSDIDDLAQCYAAWVEFELRHEQWDDALSVARTSVASSQNQKSTRASRSLVKSLRLWNLLLDLEESLGTVQTTKDAYNRALELKVATPNHVLNYATFLTEHRYFEESFTAYERGIDLFAFPHKGAKLLWKEYLTSFVKRYAGSKTSRVRELFDRCLASCPSESCSEFYLLYGQYEEDHGLTKRALSVYERMCTDVPPEEKYTAYQLYITKTVRYLGVTNARPLYERAIAALEDAPASRMCLDFAALETKLHELDRARTAYAYGAQLADPRRDPDYWKAWHEFEVAHGNEETFREMLRVKRGVQAAFSTVNYNAAEMGAGVPKVEVLSDQAALEMIAAREGVKANEQPRISGFVQGKRTAEMADLDEVERRAEKLRKATSTAATTALEGGGGASSSAKHEEDEIDIDDLDDDDEDDGQEEVQRKPGEVESNVQNVCTKAIPSAVFGGLASKANDSK